MSKPTATDSNAPPLVVRDLVKRYKDGWFELAVLSGFAVATMALGLWRLRWREE